MRKQILLRLFLLVALLMAASFVLMVSTNFSDEALTTVLSTLGIIVLLALIIIYFIVRKSR